MGTARGTVSVNGDVALRGATEHDLTAFRDCKWGAKAGGRGAGRPPERPAYLRSPAAVLATHPSRSRRQGASSASAGTGLTVRRETKISTLVRVIKLRVSEGQSPSQTRWAGGG